MVVSLRGFGLFGRAFGMGHYSWFSDPTVRTAKRAKSNDAHIRKEELFCVPAHSRTPRTAVRREPFFSAVARCCIYNRSRFRYGFPPDLSLLRFRAVSSSNRPSLVDENLQGTDDFVCSRYHTVGETRCAVNFCKEKLNQASNYAEVVSEALRLTLSSHYRIKSCFFRIAAINEMLMFRGTGDIQASTFDVLETGLQAVSVKAAPIHYNESQSTAE